MVEQQPDFEYVPINVIDRPFSGAYCLADHWWVVDANNEARIYIKKGAYTPQCNTQRAVIDGRLKEGERAVLIPFAFIDAYKYFGN